MTDPGLKTLDNKCSAILEIIGAPIFVIDDKGKFVYANTAFCSIHGVGRENIIGKIFAEALPNEETASLLEADKQVLESGKENICEVLITVHDGKVLTLVVKKRGLSMNKEIGL